MNGESAGADPPQSGDNEPDEFVLREAEILVGHGGMAGGGLGGSTGSRRVTLESQLHDVDCAECGVIARDVPAIAIESYRRQHEADAHADIYPRRKKLELAIIALNRRLWRQQRHTPEQEKP